MASIDAAVNRGSGAGPGSTGRARDAARPSPEPTPAVPKRHVHSAVRGNGNAIGNYLRKLEAQGVSPDVYEAEHLRADDLGQFLYPMAAWAEGTRQTGLSLALKHGLTLEETHCIQAWTQQRYCDDLNPLLRAGKPIPEEHRYLHENLLAGLAKLPGYTSRTYRGTALPQSLVEELQRTGVLEDAAILASSKEKRVALQFIPARKEGQVPVLMSIDSTRGRDISLIGWHHELREVEFLPNTRFEVVSMKTDEQGILHLHLRDAADAPGNLGWTTH